MEETNSTTLKLLSDSKTNKVLFAESSKDFVDFLFFLLSLPIGSVINLLSTKSVVGSIGNLYKSFSDLKETFLQPNLEKKILLNHIPPSSVSNVPLLLGPASEPPSKKFYTCSRNCGDKAVTDTFNLVGCPSCNRLMNMEISYIAGVNTNVFKGKGFVKEVITYMISDDLCVTPMSMISTISMMNKFQVTELDVLQEKEVEVGSKEALELLKLSFQSKTVLTDVFLGKKKLNTTV